MNSKFIYAKLFSLLFVGSINCTDLHNNFSSKDIKNEIQKTPHFANEVADLISTYATEFFRGRIYIVPNKCESTVSEAFFNVEYKEKYKKRFADINDYDQLIQVGACSRDDWQDDWVHHSSNKILGKFPFPAQIPLRLFKNNDGTFKKDGDIIYLVLNVFIDAPKNTISKQYFFELEISQNSSQYAYNEIGNLIEGLIA